MLIHDNDNNNNNDKDNDDDDDDGTLKDTKGILGDTRGLWDTRKHSKLSKPSLHHYKTFQDLFQSVAMWHT